MKKYRASHFRGWIYASAGDYHRNLDPNWSYTPTYYRKMALVRRELDKIAPACLVLDAGCGEGVLVEEYRAKGYNIEGLDLNYESEYVRQGSVLNMPYQDASFDCILLLDVFEHIGFADQPKALCEIHRILRDDGTFIASIPNLAHLNSRFRLMCFGSLDRSDNEIDHPGERPLAENRALLEKYRFSILKIQGITLTVPILYRRIICRKPAWFRWLHDLLQPIAIPSLSMINLFVCKKKQGALD